MQRIHGLVSQISTTYMGVPYQSTTYRVVRILLCICALMAILPLLVALWVVRDILSSRDKAPSGPGLFQQVFEYWLGIKLWNRSQTPIRDFRVRESGTGRIWLVRMRGQLTEGDISRGDFVTILAEDSNGTLLFRKGMNHSIRSRIAVAG